MSHWAEISDEAKVLRVLVGADDTSDTQDWLVNNLGGTWVRTSLTSIGGKRINPDTGEELSHDHFRFNYANIGDTFDPNAGEDGAFYAPSPYPSWVLNTDSYTWEPPVPKPSEEFNWQWDEATTQWANVPDGGEEQ